MGFIFNNGKYHYIGKQSTETELIETLSNTCRLFNQRIIGVTG